MNRKLTLTVLLAAIVVVAIAAYLVTGTGPGEDPEETASAVGEPSATPEPVAQQIIAETEPEPATEQAPAEETASSEASEPDEPEPQAAEAPAAEPVEPETAETKPTAETPAEVSEAEPAEEGASEPAAVSVSEAAPPAEEPEAVAPKTEEPVAEDAVQADSPPAMAEAAELETQPASQATSEAALAPAETQSETAPGDVQLGALPDIDETVEIELPPAVLPSFDVVRVEPNGDAVIAGRAEPGSLVVLESNGERLAEARADGAGDWIMILDWALGPGSHQLSLSAESARGETLRSANVVVVAVAEPKPQGPQPEPEEEAPQAVAEAEPVAEPESSGTPDVPAAAAESGGSATAVPEPAETESAETEPTEAEIAAAPAPAPEPDAPDPAATARENAEAPAEPAPEQPLAVVTPREGGAASVVVQAPEGPGISDHDLVLRAIEYDPDGQVIISGRGSPGAQVLLYIDNQPIGQTVVAEDGHWSLSPGSEVAVGLHRLRVDQLDAGGQVLARIETPFSRADALVELPENRFVVVQPGNSLWRIARRTYGDGVRYSVIYENNQSQIRDPDLIYPGQIFLVPRVN